MDWHEVIRQVLPYIYLLYFVDCLHWSPNPHAVLSSAWGGFYKLGYGGFQITGILPTQLMFALDPSRLLLTGGGLLAQYPPPRLLYPWRRDQSRLISWKEARGAVAEGREVCVGRERIALATPQAASVWAGRLAKTAELPAGKREAAVRSLNRRALDAARFRRRHDLCLRALLPLRIGGAALWTLLFILAPVHAFWPTPLPFLWLHGAALLVCLVGVVFMAIRLHRKFYPRLRSQRWGLGLTMACFPLSAAHAADTVSRGLHARFNLAAAAAVLLPPQSAWRFMAAEKGRLEEAVVESGAAELSASLDAYSEAVDGIALIMKWPEAWRQSAAASDDPAAAAYCPVCLDAYREGFDSCSDCGVPLRKF